MGVIEKDMKRVVMLSDSETSSSPYAANRHCDDALRRRFFTTFTMTIFLTKFITLNLSKHRRAKASARVLRQAQDDSQHLQKQSVIARYEAISELYRLPVHKFAIVFLLCILTAGNVWAKTSNTVKNDTVPNIEPKHKASLNSPTPLYIVNGKMIEVITVAELGQLDPQNILQSYKLEGTMGTAQYGPKAVNGVIIITTKAFAIEQYKRKFSEVSDDYRKYLKNHNNDDSRLGYFNVNDGSIYTHNDKSIGEIYNLSKKVTKVSLFRKKDFEDLETTMVIIETNKQQP